MQNNKFYKDFTLQITRIKEIFNINSQKLIEKYLNTEG